MSVLEQIESKDKSRSSWMRVSRGEEDFVNVILSLSFSVEV